MFQNKQAKPIRRAVATKASLRVQFLLTFFWEGGGEEQEALTFSVMMTRLGPHLIV